MVSRADRAGRAISLHDDANGFACIRTSSALQRLRLGVLLMFRYGFLRRGRGTGLVADEAIYPAFVRGDLRIESGYDHRCGYDLLATDTASEQFLRRFHARHCR